MSSKNMGRFRRPTLQVGLYGKLISPQNQKGFCKLHKCYLTDADIKNRECIEKGCNAFKKFNKTKYVTYIVIGGDI